MKEHSGNADGNQTADDLPGESTERLMVLPSTIQPHSITFYTACKVCQSLKLAPLYLSGHEKLPIFSCRSCGLCFVGRSFDSKEQRAIYQDEADYLAYVHAERSVPQVTARYRRSLNQI